MPTAVVGIWSVIFESFICFFVTIGVRRLNSDNRSMINYAFKTLTFYKVMYQHI